MNTAILLLILIITWLLSLTVSFMGGFYYCQMKRYTRKSKSLTEAEKKEHRQNQIEFENFMNYNGRPQDVIGDE